MSVVFSNYNPHKGFSNIHERDLYDKAYMVIVDLGNIVNIMGYDDVVAEALRDSFIRSHRTLQQSCIRSVVDMLILWSKGEKDRLVDARNEGAWEFAIEIDGCHRYFPFV